MDHNTSVRSSIAAAAANHGPHIAGGTALAVIAVIVLPFDGPLAQYIIGLVAALIGGRLVMAVESRWHNGRK